MGRQYASSRYGEWGTTSEDKAWSARVLSRFGTVCHLCGGEGADTADHLLPVSVAPELRHDLDNGRPAHRRCNSRKGNRPASPPAGVVVRRGVL